MHRGTTKKRLKARSTYSKSQKLFTMQGNDSMTKGLPEGSTKIKTPILQSSYPACELQGCRDAGMQDNDTGTFYTKIL
jgi:hypothetical protein